MAVKINGEVLPEEAIEYEFRRLLQFYSQYMPAEELKNQVDSLRQKAVEQAIGAKLLVDEAARLDIKVPPERVDQRINEMIEQVGGEEVFEQRLKEQGVTGEQLWKDIERGAKVDILVENITSEAPEPTLDEMQAHFEANKDQFVKSERVSASHILVKPASDSDEDRVAAEKKIEEIRQKIADGADFAELAAEHSECPSGKQSGGSLGWFQRGMMVPEFDNAVFSMEVGELSDIIETQFGFHIISKTGAEDAGEASYPDAEPKIRDILRHAKRGELLSAHVEELREKAVIENS